MEIVHGLGMAPRQRSGGTSFERAYCSHMDSTVYDHEFHLLPTSLFPFSSRFSTQFVEWWP